VRILVAGTVPWGEEGVIMRSILPYSSVVFDLFLLILIIALPADC
jgi:hypothetical protein